MSRRGTITELPAKLALPATEPVGPARKPRTRSSRPQHRPDAKASELDTFDIAQRIDYLRHTFEEGQNAPRRRAMQHRAPRLAQILRRTWLKMYAPCVRILRSGFAAPADPWASLTASLSNPTARRLFKTAAALAVAVFVGWGPVQRLMQTTSVEAVVNARVITLRAPIDGEVSAAPTSLAVGAVLTPGASLVKIVNRRADRTRLDDLRREVGRLEDERATLETKLASTKSLHAEFVAQTQQFQQGRVQQLEARTDEIRSELAAARSRREETAAILQRTSALEARGASTRAILDKAQRDNEIATQGIAATEHRLKAVEVELAAARTGFFLGDSYNDRPRSAQRADELQQQVSELAAELRQREARLARLNVEVGEEAARFADLSEATISAPSNGSVWEILTAPGEEVRRGQDLARMLDCRGTLVTAAVAESVYNRLRIGQPARFRFREGGRELDGRVVHLTGVAAAPANFAIAPSALVREAYRVTVAIPELAQSPTCHLGRTGRVTFGSAPENAPAATASIHSQ